MRFTAFDYGSTERGERRVQGLNLFLLLQVKSWILNLHIMIIAMELHWFAIHGLSMTACKM